MSSPDPLFGYNPFQLAGSNMYMPIDPYPDYTVVRAQRTQRQAMLFQQAAQLKAASMFAGVDLTDLTPDEWTPQEAVDQTALALAKISTVNPELARELAARRGAAPQQEKGFIGDLFGAIGGVIGGGLSLGGKALELIGGTMNIVPNLLYDAVDGGSFDPVEDVMGGFTGQRRHNWNSLMQRAGLDGDGALGAFRAVLGFGLDVLTDPLTYATVGASAAAEGSFRVARAAVTEAPAFLDDIKRLAPAGDDAVKWFSTQLDKMVGGNASDFIRLSKEFGGKDIEQHLARMAANRYTEEQTRLLARAYETIDRTFNAARFGELGKVLKNGYITLHSGEQVAVSREMFETIIKRGAGAKAGSAEWSTARAMAASIPGLRYRLAVPMTNIRYISPALPYSEWTGRAFNSTRKMLAGQLGMQKMLALVEAGEISPRVLDHWMQNGWESFASAYPEVAGKFKTWNNLGGGLYTASEQIGKLTGHFSASARASRQGLMGYLSYREQRAISERMRSFVNRVGWGGKIEGPTGEVLDRKALFEEMKRLGYDYRPNKIKVPLQMQEDFFRYLELPDDLALSSRGNFDGLREELTARWVEPEQKRALEAATKEATEQTGEELDDIALLELEFQMRMTPDEKLARAQQRVDDAMTLIERLPQEHMQLADKFRSIQEYLRTQLGEMGHGLGTVKANFNLVHKIRSTQIAQFLYGGEYNYWRTPGRPTGWIHSESVAANAEASILGGADQALRSNGFAMGVELHVIPGANPGHSGATEATARFKRLFEIDIDRTYNNQMADIEDILASIEETSAVYHQASEGVRDYGEIGTIVGDAQLDAKRAAQVSEHLKAQGYDGIAIRNQGQLERMVIFDPSNVKIVDEAADEVIMHRGYAPRIVMPSVREWIRGHVSAADRRVLWQVPNLEAALSRATIDLTWDEADQLIRNVLKDRFAGAGEEALAQLDAMPHMLEVNPVMAHLQYVENAGMALGAGLVDDYMRRLVNLGNVAPAMFSNPARGPRYQYLINMDVIKSLQKVDKKLASQVEKLAARTTRYYENQHSAQMEMSNTFDDLQTGIVHNIGFGEPSLERHIVALRRLSQIYGDVGKYLERTKRVVRSRAKSLDDEMQLWRRVMQNADEMSVTLPSGEKIAQHVRPNEPMRLTLIDEAGGVYRVEGYHAAVPHRLTSGETVGGLSAAEQKTLGEVSTGGIRVGDYSSAEIRAAEQLELERAYLEVQDEPTFLIARRGWDTADPIPVYKVTLRNTETGETFDRFVSSYDSTFAGAETRLPEVIPGQVRLYRGLNKSQPTQMPWVTSRSTAERFGRDGVLFVDVVDDRVPIGKARPDGTRPKAAISELSEITDRYIPKSAKPQLISDVEKVRRLPVEKVRRNALFDAADELEVRANQLEVADSGEAAFDELAAEGIDVRYTENYIYPVKYEGPLSAAPEQEMSELLISDVTGIRHTDLTQAVHDAAEKGQLYVLPTGEFLNATGNFRRGGIGKKLRPMTDIENDLTALRRETEVLREVQKELKSKRGAGTFAERLALNDPESLIRAAEKAGETITGVAKRVGKREAELATKLNNLQKLMNKAEKEMNAIYAEAQGVVAKMEPVLRSIDTTTGGMTGLAPLTVPGMRGYAAPTFIAGEMNKLFETTKITKVRQLWREWVMGPWKRWATYRWPGFHARNVMGAWFNNLLGGVTNEDYVFAHRILRSKKWYNKPLEEADWARMSLERMFPAELKGKLTYGQLGTYLADDGIGQGNTMAMFAAQDGVSNLRDGANVTKRSLNKIRQTAQDFDGILRSSGDNIEAYFRTAAWSRGMASTGGDRLSARSFVMMRHGDYHDLTDLETTAKDIIPFYKWMRTNIPYQFRMMIEQPGVYANIINSERVFAEAQGKDYAETQEQMPAWMREAYTIPVPASLDRVLEKIPGYNILFGGGAKRNEGMKFMVLDLPYKDLYMGLMDYMSAGFPVIRNVVESYGFEKQLFSGRPLEGNYIQAADWMQPMLPAIAAVTNSLGSQVVKQGAGGKWYIQDKFENAMTAWPVYSKFRNWVLYSDDQDRYVQRMSVLTSAIFGFTLRPADYTAAELDFYYNEIQPLLDQYRSLGVEFPKADDFQSAETASAFGLSADAFSMSADDTGFVTGFNRQ